MKSTSKMDRSALNHPAGRIKVIWLWIVFALGASALAACDTTIQTPPPITVNITAVNDLTAVAQGVQDALVATEQFHLDETATVFAQGGITLTPSPTPTLTLTPTITPTRFVTTTPTPTATDTATPTFSPFATNTPSARTDVSNGWVRVVHAWRNISTTDAAISLDVYINNDRVTRSLSLGEQTTYFKVLPGAVRVTLRNVDPNVSAPINTPPLVSTVIDVSPGGVVSAIAANRGQGLELIPLIEDPSPLPSGVSRLSILQANPTLLDTNVLLPNEQRALAYDFAPGDLVGPFDLPTGNYIVGLYDVLNPDQLMMSLPEPIRLANRVNYIMVMLPPASSTSGLTDSMLFSGVTRHLDTDLNTRFVNLSSSITSVYLDNQLQVQDIPIGGISDAIPVSRLGALMKVQDRQRNPLFEGELGPWVEGEFASGEKIILLRDDTPRETYISVLPIPLSQNPPPSAINATIRLIHALPNARPLTLQIRPVRTTSTSNVLGTPQVEQIGEDEIPWITIGDANALGLSSDYSSRVPEIYDVRVVLSGSLDVIGTPLTVQFLPGAVYDFIVLPGNNNTSARLELLQPSVQISGAGSKADNATAVYEAVNATLTALAPEITATPTRANTATATRTPVPTNTPRPSNTPGAALPVLIVEPAPPNAAAGSLNVTGLNLAAEKAFTLTLDDQQTAISTGKINVDGTLTTTTISVEGLAPGAHTLTLCVDCTARGLQQVQYAVFIVAEPNATPSATAAQ